ncbi:hypothetical protein SLEP1_g13318 [Rubroshorea leprosula]|uniref:Uncharacterized protein n=1 Tax=Rubroshorea leprosula TaxID=152421 RepID=A0AAV5IQY5_9ROSI|nr:hypothetical protein SLEP1_g13318 [Rubroshorea leprosula]
MNTFVWNENEILFSLWISLFEILGIKINLVSMKLNRILMSRPKTQIRGATDAVHS